MCVTVFSRPFQRLTREGQVAEGEGHKSSDWKVSECIRFTLLRSENLQHAITPYKVFASEFYYSNVDTVEKTGIEKSHDSEINHEHGSLANN